MYHVIGTGLTSTLLYLISYLLFRLDLIPFYLHKKLWNLILAVTFLLTVAAGLFMALQINYKWDIPFVKPILKWHVEIGVAMTFTGLFHFFWHLSYFGRIFDNQRQAIQSKAYLHPTRANAALNLFLVGLVSSSLQLLLLREMLNISGGYELISGLYLGAWLTGSSAGSVLAGKSGINDIRKINFIFAISPAVSLFLMFFLARMFLHPGETPSFMVTLIYTFLVLLPFCLISGFTFMRLLILVQRGNKFSPGKSFSIETIGGVIAGVMISYLTSGILNTYQLIFLIMLLAVSYNILSLISWHGTGRFIIRIVILLIASFLILSSPDRMFRQILLNGIVVMQTEDTPYGNITQGEYKGEKSIYYNQRLLSYNYDVTEREENIHYAMLQSRSPDKVILISGSLSSQLPEILKYKIRKLTFIERDPALAREKISLTDSLRVNISVLSTDAYRFIRQTDEKADVIISSLPPPSTLQINRYYTTEFFREVNMKLNEGGIFMCSPGPGDDYFNKESLQLLSSVFNSLRSVFRNVLPVVGNKLYFIASNSGLSLKYCELTEKRNIINTYVCRDYLSDDLIEKKSKEVAGLLEGSVKQNRLSFPAANLQFLNFSFTKTAGEKIPVILLIIVIFAAQLFLVKRNNRLMYFGAFALAGFEVSILISLQILIGNMYQLTGLILSALMAGLAAGSGTNGLFSGRFSLKTKMVVLLCYYLLCGLSYNLLIEIRHILPAMCIIMAGTFVPAYITGQIFNDLTTSQINPDGTASVYSADLSGSALGFIIFSGFSIPLFGIKVSLFIIALLIFTALLFGTIRNK